MLRFMVFCLFMFLFLKIASTALLETEQEWRNPSYIAELANYDDSYTGLRSGGGGGAAFRHNLRGTPNKQRILKKPNPRVQLKFSPSGKKQGGVVNLSDQKYRLYSDVKPISHLPMFPPITLQ